MTTKDMTTKEANAWFIKYLEEESRKAIYQIRRLQGIVIFKEIISPYNSAEHELEEAISRIESVVIAAKGKYEE